MIKTKRFLAIIIAISMLLVLFAGCEGNEPSNTADEQNLQTEANNGNLPVDGQPLWSEVPPVAEIRTGESSRTAIARQFAIARNLSADEHRGNSIYQEFRINEIEEFFCLDSLGIEGFNLSAVMMSNSSFVYYFNLEGQNRFKDGIEIGIAGLLPGFNCSAEQIRDAVDVNEDLVLVDNMFAYCEKTGILLAPLGSDREIKIIVPQSIPQRTIAEFAKARNTLNENEINEVMAEFETTNRIASQVNSYEFLRNLALQIVENAQLVSVEQALTLVDIDTVLAEHRASN